MNGSERREKILEQLTMLDSPMSAGNLAKQFNVSRQIIVGDIALLRAAGHEIIATPRGYCLDRKPPEFTGILACMHQAEDMETELNLIVDFGGCVRDVIIEHPIYGQLTGSLQLSSRLDVSEFIQKCHAADARPLSLLTDGIHLHTVSCTNAAVFEKIKDSLRKANILIEADR